MSFVKNDCFITVTFLNCLSNICHNCEKVLDPKPFSSCVLITMTGKVDFDLDLIQIPELREA